MLMPILLALNLATCYGLATPWDRRRWQEFEKQFPPITGRDSSLIANLKIVNARNRSESAASLPGISAWKMGEYILQVELRKTLVLTNTRF